MNKINIQQARRLLEINEPVYLMVGGDILEVNKQDLLASSTDCNFKYYYFDRKNIKELIRQRLNIDASSWKYLANATGNLLLSV